MLPIPAICIGEIQKILVSVIAAPCLLTAMFKGWF